jgi:esterase
MGDVVSLCSFDNVAGFLNLSCAIQGNWKSCPSHPEAAPVSHHSHSHTKTPCANNVAFVESWSEPYPFNHFQRPRLPHIINPYLSGALSAMTLQRHEFLHDDLTFSFLDAGGTGPALIALHAHLMEAATYTSLAHALAPDYRVIALDQRGHGDSSHAATYTRDDYLGDIAALLHHLDLSTAVLLGNSLGGVNVFQFAARHPERVRALIIEDIGAVVKDDISFVLPWAGTFATYEELYNQIGTRFAPYFQDSFRHTDEGWSLPFDPRDMVRSQSHLIGDHWTDWRATQCPALLLRGEESRVTTAEQCEQMAARRPNTQLITIDGGHALHIDNPAGFNAAVKSFLQNL